jgi:hypothetical protein
MALEDLTLLEIVQGSTSLIYAVSGTIIGLIIASKYFTYEKRELLGIGIALALLTAPWYGGGISFLTYVLYGFILDDSIYFLINYGFLAVALLCWMYGMSILLWPNSTKKIMTVFSIICIPYEIIFLFTLSTNPSSIGAKEGKFNSDAALLPTVFIIFALLVSLITMIMFVRQSLRATSLKIKWKGRFLLIAVLLMAIGSAMDAIITVTPTTLLIARIILLWRLIFSYIGWLMPPSVEKWLVKDKE